MGQRHDALELVFATFFLPQQSSFFRGPMPVRAVCSECGNLRVFEYTIRDFLLAGSAEQVPATLFDHLNNVIAIS